MNCASRTDQIWYSSCSRIVTLNGLSRKRVLICSEHGFVAISDCVKEHGFE